MSPPAELAPEDVPTQVAVWAALILGWAVIVGLYVIGIVSDQKARPPYPSAGATAAASAFWFAFVLSVNSFVGFIRSALVGLDRIGWVRHVAHFWPLPVIAVGVGLFFARFAWS